MYRVVIVDDEPFMLEGMRLMIDWEGCGFELCGEASNAQDVLHLVDTLRPHLLITDVQMPGMLGTDLAAIVSHYHPEVIILFFSVYKDFKYAQSAIRSNAFGYLLKPIDTDEVHATLRRVRTELDARAPQAVGIANSMSILRDQVLRRIAQGDDSAASLMRAAVLLGLKRGDPCYCAVLARETGVVPDGVMLLATASGGVPFQLSSSQFGLGFQQIEHDLPALARLLAGLPEPEAYTLSVGKVYRGAEGFARSLREALDAQGVLFEPSGILRVYHPFDEESASWLSTVGLQRLRDALIQGDRAALKASLADLRVLAQAHMVSLFALRYMAATLDAMLPLEVGGNTSSLRPLWRSQAHAKDAWLEDFCDALACLQQTAPSQATDTWPAPVQAALWAIQTRYAQTLTIGGVAAELHMNPAYLGQLVRRFTGATFHRRLLDMRIGHACVMLRQTVCPISEVALAVGFHDVDYFSQQFRSRMGMTPVAYRGAQDIKEASHAPRQ